MPASSGEPSSRNLEDGDIDGLSLQELQRQIVALTNAVNSRLLPAAQSVPLLQARPVQAVAAVPVESGRRGTGPRLRSRGRRDQARSSAAEAIVTEVKADDDKEDNMIGRRHSMSYAKLRARRAELLKKALKEVSKVFKMRITELNACRAIVTYVDDYHIRTTALIPGRKAFANVPSRVQAYAKDAFLCILEMMRFMETCLGHVRESIKGLRIVQRFWARDYRRNDMDDRDLSDTVDEHDSAYDAALVEYCGPRASEDRPVVSVEKIMEMRYPRLQADELEYMRGFCVTDWGRLLSHSCSNPCLSVMI